MSKLNGLAEMMKKHKKLLIVGGVAVVIAGVAIVVAGNVNQKKEQMMALMNQTQTAKVERRTLVSSVSASGTLTSVQSKDVSVNLSGMEVKSISVEVGDTVEEGQVLCVLDSEDIQEELADAKVALNVANEKTKMDLNAAEQSLQDVLEDYNIDMDRANQELLSYYQDYEKALKDMEEAKKEWDEAIQTTKDYKAEYDYQNNLLTNVENQQASISASSTYSQEFNITRTKLLEYAAANGSVSKAAESKLVIGRDLSDITVGTETTDDFYINPNGNNGTTESNGGDDNVDGIKSIINEYLSTLKSLSSRYNNANNLTENQSTLKQDVSTWESKYKSAQNEESAAEKAYDQAVSAFEASIEAYEKQLRNIDDAKKSGETSILSKSESLYSSQLSSLSSGNSEEEKVEEYQEKLQNCTVTAPISGVVTAVNVEVGDVYSGSAIVTIEDISGYEVSTEIDEYDIGKIEKGQKVIVKTNATGDEELEGTVKRISPRASSGSNDVTYTVTVALDTLHEMLRMDMSAKLSIILESKENVLTVPYEAVQEDESGKYYVEVVTNEVGAASEEGENTQLPDTAKTGEMSQMSEEAETPDDMSSSGRTKNRVGKNSGSKENGSSLTTKRVYVEKGIESDYYIEIISSEISEGMEIVVPASERSGGLDIQKIMMNQGPMGGF